MAAVVETTETETDVNLQLRYAGPSVDHGAMDVYETAANMVAFSNYVVVATHIVFGKETEVKAEVRSFRPGSFETELLFHIAGIGSTLLTMTSDLSGLLLAIKESLGLYRFLQGQKPKSVQIQVDRSVNVTNNNGVLVNIQMDSLALALDQTAGEAAGRFIGQALRAAGVNSVDIGSDRGPIIKATTDEAQYFGPIESDEASLESTLEMSLVVETPTFKDGKKWQFWDGGNSIQASMEDQVFLDAIDRGEPFRKGDILQCEVVIRQIRTGKSMRMERRIVRVIRHIPGRGTQLDLLSEPS